MVAVANQLAMDCDSELEVLATPASPTISYYCAAGFAVNELISFPGRNAAQVRHLKVSATGSIEVTVTSLGAHLRSLGGVFYTPVAGVVDSAVILAGASGFTSYLQTSCAVHSQTQLNYVGWHHVGIPTSGFVPGSGIANWNNIDSARLRFTAVSGQLTEIYFDSLVGRKTSPRAFIALTCDDGSNEHGQKTLFGNTKSVADLFSDRGMFGTFGVIPSLNDGTNYMSQANIAALMAAGHEVCFHELVDLTTLTLLEAQDKFRAFDAYINGIYGGTGWKSGALIWPYGAYSRGLCQVAMDNGYVLGREVSGPGSYTPRISVVSGLRNDGYESLGLFMLKTVGNNATTAAQMIGHINTAALRRMPICLMLHTVDATATTGIHTNESDLVTVLDHLKRLRDQGLIEVGTLADLVRRMDRNSALRLPASAGRIAA